MDKLQVEVNNAATAEANTLAKQVAPRRHEARAKLLQEEQELLRQKQHVNAQEARLGTIAGEYEAKLDETSNAAERKHLERKLRGAEKAERTQGIESRQSIVTLLT